MVPVGSGYSSSLIFLNYQKNLKERNKLPKSWIYAFYSTGFLLTYDFLKCRL
jgi:hypothetical protein